MFDIGGVRQQLFANGRSVINQYLRYRQTASPLSVPSAQPRFAWQAIDATVAELLAANVPLKDGEHFTRARKRIRAALIADGVAGDIETLVANRCRRLAINVSGRTKPIGRARGLAFGF